MPVSPAVTLRPPPPDVPVIDPKTGLVTPQWREFLDKLCLELARVGVAVP
jgi:hypothetical protein